jgi:uncharacterized MAPEG superfamily protein
MGATATALTGFIVWFIVLTIALAFYRVYVTASSGKAINSFAPDGSDTPGVGRRLTRARDNCFETLPAFAGLTVVAHIAGRLDVTDGLAMWVLYAHRPVRDARHLGRAAGDPRPRHALQRPGPDLSLLVDTATRLKGRS